MKFRFSSFIEYFLKLLPYLKVTFSYATASLLIGLILGFVLAYFKVGKSKALRAIGKTYTAIFRSIPPVVLLFLVYYGLPALSEKMFSISLREKDTLFFVIITISLLSIASISEVMRSAFASVDKGQYEAAVSIGVGKFWAYVRIVFPQAIFYALPSMGNIMINLVKDGSLGFTIGLVDIFGKANSLNNNTFSNYILEIYISLALIYWGVSFLLEKLLNVLEHTFSINKPVKQEVKG